MGYPPTGGVIISPAYIPSLPSPPLPLPPVRCQEAVHAGSPAVADLPHLLQECPRVLGDLLLPLVVWLEGEEGPNTAATHHH